MIRSKDLNAEVKVLELKAEKNANSIGLVDVLKAMLLVLKVVRDIRTNQVNVIRTMPGGEGILIKQRTPNQPDRAGEKK
jgi:hypothetical protein